MPFPILHIMTGLANEDLLLIRSKRLGIFKDGPLLETPAEYKRRCAKNGEVAGGDTGNDETLG